MRQIFENVHAAVAQDLKGHTKYNEATLIDAPNVFEKPLYAVYSEFAGVIAGVALSDDKKPAAEFLGYHHGNKGIEVVAVRPIGYNSVIDAAHGSAALHIESFATRLRVEGYTFNREYAI